MVDSRLRVDVGVQPYVLSSALHECLRQDARLDVVLLPQHCDESLDTVGSVMLPGQYSPPQARVVAVLDCPPRVEVTVAGTSRLLPYEGMDRLADALVKECSATADTVQELAATNGGTR